MSAFEPRHGLRRVHPDHWFYGALTVALLAFGSGTGTTLAYLIGAGVFR